MMGLQVHGDTNMNYHHHHQNEGDQNDDVWPNNNNDGGDQDQGDLVLDVSADASIFYDEFPPLPDFPSMSSSSSSSSNPATVKPIGCSSTSSSASASSSAASWAVLRSEDAEEERMEGESYQNHPNNISNDSFEQSLQNQISYNEHNLYGQYNPILTDTTQNAAALSSTASMDICQGLEQLQEEGSKIGCGGIDDCMDIMESFGFMDLLGNGEFLDSSSLFQSNDGNNLLEELQQEPLPPFDDPQVLQGRGSNGIYNNEMMMMMTTNDEALTSQLDGGFRDGGGGSAAAGSEDLAMVFLEWLKNNKETVSAEDLRRVKIKKATIECAANRLGGGKEGMKQLLKLILEWVQTNHLQMRRNGNMRESSSLVNSDSSNNFSQQYQDPLQNPNPTSNHFLIPNPTFNQTAPDHNSAHCFAQSSQSPWSVPPQPYYPDPVSGYPHMVGYMPEPFVNGPASGSTPNVNHYQPPADRYHNMFGSLQPQPWSSHLGMASHCTTCPDNSLQGGPSVRTHPSPAFSGYGADQYPYNQYLKGYRGGSGDYNRLVGLGSSATREARKKRMERHRRLVSQHRSHNHHQSAQQSIQVLDQHQHARLGNDNPTPATFPLQTNVPPNWVYWPTPPPMATTAPIMPVKQQPTAPVPPVVEDRQPLMQQPQSGYQRPGPLSDRRQVCGY